MAIPLQQKIRVGAYVLGRHLRGVKRYPLVLMLEPLFRCNLACAGCGKIDYPPEILNQRLSVAECMEAVDECGAPVVVITGIVGGCGAKSASAVRNSGSTGSKLG